jgi:hypothetical protein
MKNINKIQKAFLTLIKETSINKFDGKKIYKDLIKYSNLWKGVVFGRFFNYELIILRDLPEGIYNADTMFISIPTKNLPKFKKIIEKWDPTEINIITLSPQQSYKVSPNIRLDLFKMWGSTDTGDLSIIKLYWD